MAEDYAPDRRIPCVILVCRRKGRRPALGGGALCHRHALYRDWRQIQSWWRWVRQGRPREIPVVFQEGRIIRDPLGHILCTDWGWDFNRMTPGLVIDGALLVDYLTLRYPHTVEQTSDLL